MARGVTIGRSDKAIALSMVVVLHAAALLALLLQRAQSVIIPPEGGALKVIALGAASPPAKPVLPVPKAMIEEALLEPPLATLVAESTGSASSADGGCLSLEEVRQAIANDPAAVASALAAPPEIKSVAEAVLIWNGDWIQAAGTADAPLAATRSAIERSVATMSNNCLDEPITGPRLVPFPAGLGTMFLVFGSGNWRWRDIANDMFVDPASTETSRL